jgi:hypothetical protein
MTALLLGVVLMALGVVLTMGGVMIRAREGVPTPISPKTWAVFGLGIWFALSTPRLATAGPVAGPDLSQDPSTFQDWTFDKPPADPATIAPDVNGNTAPGGPPVAHAAGTGYSDSILGQQGVLIMPAGLPISFVIPNFADPNATKTVVLNLVYRVGTTPEGGQLGFGDLPFVQGFDGEFVRDSMFNSMNWRFLVMNYTKSPCPASETLIIPGLANDLLLIDSVTIATDCVVPEPSTLVLGTIGALTGLCAWRRKRLRATA